jgi:hypothetical protein
MLDRIWIASALFFLSMAASAQNTAPVVNPDSYATPIATPITVAAPGIFG